MGSQVTMLVEATLLLFSLFPLEFSTVGAPLELYVSGYSDRATVYTLTRQGKGVSITKKWETEVPASMSWAQIIDDRLYGSHELENWNNTGGGLISVWKLGAGGMTPVSKVTLPSPFPAHLLVEPDHSLAYIAYYGGNSFSALSMGEEGPAPVAYHEGFGEDLGCRDASHPHQTVSLGDLVWVVDLGCDSVWHYRRDQGGISKGQRTQLTKGAGPRHMAVSADRGLAVIVSELKSLMELFRVNPENGSLTLLQTLTLSTDPGDYGAEVLFGPQEDFVYASSRGTGVVLVYGLDKGQDKLERLQEFKLQGTWPRHMAIKEDLLVVADQKGNTLQVIKINQKTGLLENIENNIEDKTPEGPAFVAFL